MCTVWGYAQGWWTVTGLSSDILGFTILAIDLSREYLRHLRVKQFEEAARAAEWLALDYLKPPVADDLEPIDSRLKAARYEMRHLRRRLNEQEIR